MPLRVTGCDRIPTLSTRRNRTPTLPAGRDRTLTGSSCLLSTIRILLASPPACGVHQGRAAQYVSLVHFLSPPHSLRESLQGSIMCQCLYRRLFLSINFTCWAIFRGAPVSLLLPLLSALRLASSCTGSLLLALRLAFFQHFGSLIRALAPFIARHVFQQQRLSGLRNERVLGLFVCGWLLGHRHSL